MPDLSKTLRAAFTRAMNRRAGLRHGRLDWIEDFPSIVLGNSRRLSVYLPAGYDDHPERRYPVLYMQDGQNLFEPARAFAGQDWRLQAAADEAIGRRTMRAVIIVGVDHAEVDRVHEYTPVVDPEKEAGGRGDAYASMLTGELKPLIDARFRTIESMSAVGGSSLGGLISLHLVLQHPDVFHAAAVMSPSVWWGGRAIIDAVDRVPPGERPRVWLDIGGREGREALSDARLLRDRMRAHGWTDANLRFFEDRRGDHSEAAWRGRVRKALEFLFPPE